MTLLRKTAMAAALLPLLASPVSAQRWHWDLGINGGYSWLTNMLGEDETLLTDGSGGSRIRFEGGWLVGSQLTYWAASRIGFRANFRYSDRDVVGNNISDFAFVDNVNLWGGTIDFMYRFKNPAAEFTRREILPYVALGAGMKWHNPGGDQFSCFDLQESKAWSCGPFTTGLPGAPVTFALAEQSVFAGLVGTGAWHAPGRSARRSTIRSSNPRSIWRHAWA